MLYLQQHLIDIMEKRRNVHFTHTYKLVKLCYLTE